MISLAFNSPKDLQKVIKQARAKHDQDEGRVTPSSLVNMFRNAGIPIIEVKH